MWSIKVQDLYKVLVTESGGIAASGDVNFTLSSAPRYTNGFLVIEPDSTTNRETVYFHNVVGNRVYVRWVNRKNPKFHAVSTTVQMNDVEEIFNFYSDMTSPLFYVEKTGGLNVRVWGGTVLVNSSQTIIPDTNLTLTNNTTNYIVYDYVTNVVSVNTTGTGLVKATAVVVSGLITSIVYNVIKESYVNQGTLVAEWIQKQSWVFWVDSGTSNTHIVSISPSIITYNIWLKVSFKSNFTNTWPTSININSIWVVPIKKQIINNIWIWEIVTWQILEVVFDGTNFQIVSQLSRDKIWDDYSQISILSPWDKVLVWEYQTWIIKSALISQLSPFIANPSLWDESITISYDSQWRIISISDIISQDVININWDNIGNWTLIIQKVWDPKTYTATYNVTGVLNSITYI